VSHEDGRHHLGSWHRHLNSYSLAMMGALHATCAGRTTEAGVLLTRSAFAGSSGRRHHWSGDIGSSWTSTQQIAAGLNFSMSGCRTGR
jgi:alpha-glucosidase (family GH31 glycosyl hydrolase)